MRGVPQVDPADSGPVAELLVQATDRRVPLVVARPQLLVAVGLGPADLRRLQRPGDPTTTPGPLDSGQGVVGGGRLRRGERVRVADHFAPAKRDERGLGPVTGAALHLVGEPVLERLDQVVLEARNIRKRLERDVVHAAIELGPLGPGDDLDAGGRLDRRRVDLREIEDNALFPPLLDERAPFREGEARGVVVEDGTSILSSFRSRPKLEIAS